MDMFMVYEGRVSKERKTKRKEEGNAVWGESLRTEEKQKPALLVTLERGAPVKNRAEA